MEKQPFKRLKTPQKGLLAERQNGVMVLKMVLGSAVVF
jgi:hypothetical protein